MTRLINNKKQNSQRKRAGSSRLLAAALTMVLVMTTGLVQAQSPEVGGGNQYRAEKTVNDYMTADQSRSNSDFDYAGNTLRVEVWVDKPQGDIYRKGEDLGVGFQTNQDAYAVVYRIDTEGLVTVLWPRSRFDDGFIFGGHEYQVPVSGARQMRVSTREGEGIIEAVVSQYPFDLRSLELDFHHENTTDQYAFRVAGDPFLAMNEVNYAVTGLEDSGEYVVTNYVSYYVHQEVDHPRYLCDQCHVEEPVAYDPYRDECTMTIEYDYSWYNGWYDTYGYYPVYGNPVYVYIDPWNYNPWVNYWYSPSYVCAPWYGWGWGWNSCYGWYDSPYYYGNSVTAYSSGYERYRPLDRTQVGRSDVATKTREYSRGSSMVRKSNLSDGERGAMVSRTRSPNRSNDGVTTVGRSRGSDVAYRGADPKARTRSSYDQAAVSGRSQSGLRIRESGRTVGTSRTANVTDRKRHTSAGEGRQAGLVPVNESTNNWRGTTRVGGSATGSRGTSLTTPTTVGNSANGSSRTSGTATNSRSNVQEQRTRTSSDSKSVQQRKRSTRVWNSTGTSSRGSTRSSSTRARNEATTNRSTRSGTTTSRSSGTVSPRKSTVKKSTNNSSSSSSRSSSSVKKSSSNSSSSGSRSSSSSSRGGSSSRSSGSSSRGGTSRR